MLQPSSIDVRLDRYFRVFENHKYPHIDPSIEQPDLTRLIEPDGDDPFILHPGEFVLGSTFEVVTLPDDIAGRLNQDAADVKALGINSTPTFFLNGKRLEDVSLESLVANVKLAVENS